MAVAVDGSGCVGPQVLNLLNLHHYHILIWTYSNFVKTC